MSNDTETTTNTEPIVEAAPQAPVETPSEGTQPDGNVEVTPVPEKQGSDYIPRSRLNEVIQERNREREEKAQLLALLQRNAPVTQVSDQQKPVEPQAPKQEEFQTYEEFIRADAKFTAEQAAEKRWNDLQAKHQSEQRAQSEQQVRTARTQTAFTEFNKAAGEYAKSNPDFVDLPLQPLFSLGEDLALTVLETKNPQLLEQICKTPGLSERLQRMTPAQAAREVWQMEGKLLGSSGQPIKKPSANIPSLSPVGAGRGPGSKHANDFTVDDVTKRLYPI